MSDIPAAIPAPHPPEANSRRGGTLAWTLAIIGFLSVVVSQHLVRPGEPAGGEKPTSALTPPAPDDPRTQSARLLVKLGTLVKSMDPGAGAMLVGQGIEKTDDPIEQFQDAIVAGELAGPDAARKRLGEINLDGPTWLDRPLNATERAQLEEHVASYRRILDAQGAELTQAARDDLAKAHGYYGRLALVHDKPAGDLDRATLVEGGGTVVAFLIYVLSLMGVGVIGGLAAFVVMIVLLVGGKLRRHFQPPAPGESVYIETAALFFLAFLAVQTIGQFILPRLHLGIGARLGTQWLLLLVPLWPLVRGVKFSAWREQIGWHAPRGVWREVGAGILAYFAALPLLFLAIAIAYIVLVVQAAMAGKHMTPPENPVHEIIGGASSGVLVLLFTLAVVWAPIVEESIFRGAIFRQLRARMGLLLAAGISAVAFGTMHAYPLPLLLPVITLGFTFALTREWRGSLVAPMVGHFLHNATLLTLAIMVFRITQ